eukprot:4183432-Pyramimonas_sp.AAC.1
MPPSMSIQRPGKIMQKLPRGTNMFSDSLARLCRPTADHVVSSGALLEAKQALRKQSKRLDE